MKKIILLYLLFIGTLLAKAQPPCSPTGGRLQGGNTPPGCLMCGESYFGATGSYDSTTVQSVPSPCGKIDNNQFVSFIADSTGEVSVALIREHCVGGRGMEFIIYDQMLNPISHCATVTFIGIEWLRPISVIPGDIYHIMIDGIEGDICDFEVFIRKGADFSAMDTAQLNRIPELNIHGNPEGVCIDAEICYSTKYEPGIDGFLWDIIGNYKRISGGGKLDTFMCVKHSDRGTDLVYVKAIYGCHFSERNSYIMVADEFVRDSIEAVICPGNDFFVDNQSFNESGFYEITIPNGVRGGCDSIVFLDLKYIDTTSFELICLTDTFLHVLTIGWPQKPHADEYEVFINGNLVSTQNFTGYIINSPISGEELEVVVQPIGGLAECSYPSASLTCKYTGTSSILEKKEESLIQIFPNPSQGEFEIFSSKNEKLIEKIEVFDFCGKKIATGLGNKIDLLKFDSGIYFFKIHIDGKVILKKVIKSI